MYHPSGFDSVQSSGNLNSQHMLSRSNSRLQSSIQKIDSHIKSTLPFLQGKGEKKYIYFKYHKFFQENKIEGFKDLMALLQEQFEDKIQFRPFKERKELLKDNYNDNELHYIIVPKFDLDWASMFAKQQREENNSKVNIYVYGILKKQDYDEKIKVRSKKKIDAIPNYVDYFYFDEQDYPQKIVTAMEAHLDVRLREEGQHLKTWALTNKFAGKKIKKRTLHFFYEQKMSAEFTGIYKLYKKKSKSSWLQAYPFANFQDVLKKIREREVAQTKELDVARRATSKIMSEVQAMEPVSMKSMMKSGIMDMMGSQLNSSVLTSSIRAINKLDKDDLNIIICNNSHSEIEKFRVLVRAQKFNNWFLWQIEEKSADVIGKLKDFLSQQARNNQILQNQEYQRILHCKHLNIMAHINDEATIGIFQNHRNVFNHMELILYNDPDEFSLFLREGVNSLQNFTIAVVPGGFRSFAVEYTRAINEFIAAYRNMDQVENFKFISSAVGRHGSSVFPASNMFGVQSSLTDVKGRYDQDLQKIMQERDKLFHPFEGLTGINVYLLIRQDIADQLEGISSYIGESPRIKKRTYMDREWLKLSLETLLIKDSVIVVANDNTLRQAQQVLQGFQKAFILNITDRQNLKQEKNVVAQGTREHIYELIKTINPEASVLDDQHYDQSTFDYSLTRKNRVLPKNIEFRQGNMISIHLPASLKDEESDKMQSRLYKYFYGDIKIEYYKHPNELRILNKAEDPLAFIIWAYHSKLSEGERKKLMDELQFLKEMAVNENEELRQEYIIYSDVPQEFKELVQDDRHERFKFLSSRWERIEEYIIGHLKRPNFDTIFSDETMMVFYNESDVLSKQAIECVSGRKNGEKINAANHIQFRAIEDLIKTLDQESPLFKYYILLNEDSSKLSLKDVERTINQEQYRQHYIKVILIKQLGGKRFQKANGLVRTSASSYRDAGEWLCNTTVLPINYSYITPHVVVDKNTLHYYYFLDKYSAMTNKFTFSYISSKEELKKIVSEQREAGKQHIWVLVKELRVMNDYIKSLEKLQNYKKGNVRFICQNSEGIHPSLRSRVVFQNDSKKEIQKFLLNIYRRDKHIFFPSSVGAIGSVVLAIMKKANGSSIAINEQQIARWQNILKAKVYNPKSINELNELVFSFPNCMYYVVAPVCIRQDLRNLFGVADNVKRIFYVTFQEYNFRVLDQEKIVEDSGELFWGTYPAEISDFLRYLRYNIRKPEAMLEKSIQNQLIELYIQEEHKLSPFEVKALTIKNDSLIINRNGYKVSSLPQLLKTSNNFNYLHVFVGDDQSGRQIQDFNSKYKRDVKFIDLKTSDLAIARGESKNKNWLLQTNDGRELLTFLFNLPENRYQKALNHRGKFNLFVNPNASNTYVYYEELQKIQKRNPNIIVNIFNNFGQEVRNLKETGHVLIHSENERQAHEMLDRKDIYYFIANQEFKPEKSYTSTGNKQFVAKKKIEFQHFMNQLPVGSDHDIEPIAINLDEAEALLNNIKEFGSAPLPITYNALSALPPFYSLPTQEKDFVTVELFPNTVDSNPPTFSNMTFLKADIPPQVLGLDVLKRIKDSIVGEVDGNVLQGGVDYAPTRDFTHIKSAPDSFVSIPLPLSEPPRPPPVIRQKLAVLHPSTFQFIQIGQMLKRNMEPDQFSLVTLIPYRSEVQLQDYSKNNGQKLNGYDKIVVFLSNIYRKYDPILKAMKGKLGGRMEYFIFDDSFHIENHQKLKTHLRPYRIKRQELPYSSQTIPKFMNRCAKILILVPPHFQRKYETLKSSYINVVVYNSQSDTYRYLHSENTFIILVTTRQMYHSFKMHAKISPCCILLVDTDSQLPEDELYLYRIWMYCLFYGPNGEEYLRKILPSRPVAPFHEKNRYLFYGFGEEELVFVGDYEEYQKIFFKDWLELYNYLITIFKGKSNWLIKNSPGKPELVPLNPVVYLQGKQYMKDFKNNFIDNGYLNEEIIPRKSRIVMHQFSDLPEVYYTDQRDLVRHLEKQEAPCVVLFNLSNQARMAFLRGKFNKHKWIGLTDNRERWIDNEGILLDVDDLRLKRKQDVFANLFNKDVFDAWNDMRYFYLSNKANLDKARNIFFRTKEELLEIYNKQPNLLMVVFAEAKDINHVPQALMAEASEPGGRVKLILLSIDFVDEEVFLYIKFNEIDPVIKHINDVESAGRIDFMVYHQGEGQRVVQTLIQKKKLKGLDDRVYQTMDEVQEIAIQIKGKYRKVYVVCFQDQKQQIDNIFKKYSICNKGIPGEGVEFYFIDRKSFIIPNSSRLQPGGSQVIQNSTINARIIANGNLPASNSKLAIHGQDEVEINVHVRSNSNPNDPRYDNVTTHREVIAITHEQPEEDKNDENEDYGVPSMDSNIKPANKLQSILSSKNYILNIDEKLKGLFPVGKFFANKATFFTNPNEIPPAEKGAAQLIVSTQMSPQVVDLSQDSEKYVIVVGRVPESQKKIGNVVMMKEDEIPGLIKRLQGSNVQDELKDIKNLDDFSKVRVVYDKDIDFESKRRLLAASDKNPKIYPIVYKNVNELKTFLKEPDSLLLLMMKEVPPGLADAVEKQNKTIIKKKKVKMIVPKRSESDIDGLETILQEQEVEQEGDNLKYLSDEQVDVYLKLFQTYLDQRPKITKPDDWQGEREHDRYEAEAADMDNITRLNVHSNIDPGNLIHQNEIEKIKQRLTGDLIVLVVDNSKRGQVDEAIKRFNVLVQGYTNSMNLQNDIRDRKDNVTIAVIDRNMLDKIPVIKKKYPQTAFILESDNPHDEGIEIYRPYLSGQIRKIGELDKIIADLYQENQRIRFNTESNKVASRFQKKNTSIVDLSNNQRFSVGLSNQKSKKAFLFYKQPDNSHIRVKLGENFANLNFVPYKSVLDFKRLIDTYNNYSSILIANGNDIPDLEEIVSKKKELIYVIRFNPPPELRDNPKVKKLLSTYKRDDLERFIIDEFQKYSLALPYDEIGMKYKTTKNVEGKRYIQKYEPNTFGTTPRFARDFVPPKSKESTYSRRYMKSTSRSKLNSRLDAMSPKSQRNEEYFVG